MRIIFLLFVYLLVLDSEGSSPVPAPEHTKILSKHFIHILQWNPGKGTQPGTVYNVNVDKNQVQNITGTSTDISKYMTDVYPTYEIQLWASFGNRSSSKVIIPFSPYTSTVIGPPELSLSGCGDCLNISIDLPHRHGSAYKFYSNVQFDILWRKANDEKDGCHNSFNNSQRTKSVPYSYILHNLQPGERYCVQAQPWISSLPEQNRLISCSCEFTSQIELRGVTFLACWVASSMLVGLFFLTSVFFLVYAGFLCKPNVRLPKALMVNVSGFLLFPEETCLSVAEVENGVQIHILNNKVTKSKQIYEDEDDNESQNGYMNRGAPNESGCTSSVKSAYNWKAVEEPDERCSFVDVPTHAVDTSQLSQVRYHPGESYSLVALLDPISKTSKRLISERDGKQLKEEMIKEVTEEDSRNINLWSVVLKSMQQQEEEINESTDAVQPLLFLAGKKIEEKAASQQTGHSLHQTALSFLAQMDKQSDQDQENELSHTSEYKNTPTGYMASHRGTIDTENCSDEDEDNCMSVYMFR